MKKIFNIHIPRTGGTSLYYEFEELFGSKNVLTYNIFKRQAIRMNNLFISPASNRLTFAKNILGEKPLKFFYKAYVNFMKTKLSDVALPWISLENLDKTDFRAIQGHILPEDVKRIYNSLRSPFLTVILRNPLDRMVSHYLYVKRAGVNPGWVGSVSLKDNITFKQYALSTEMKNYQTKCLSGIPLEKFDLVGALEHLDSFVAKIKKEQSKDKEIARANAMNSKEKHDSLGISKSFLNKFKKHHRKDYENYYKALEVAQDYNSQ